MWPVTLGIETIFLDIFGNLVFDIMLIIFLLIGLLGGIFLRPWFGNQVIKIMEKDYRFVDLDIEEETAVSISCKDKKGMPSQRFFKWRPGYTGIIGKFLKKPVTRWFGREGTAYTWKLEGEGKRVDIGKLDAAVKTVWGEEFWNSVPKKQKTQLEESILNVTVELEKGPLTPEKMIPVSEENIMDEQDRAASETFWEGKRQLLKNQWVQWIFIFVAGFGVAAVLQIIGILRIPSGETTTPPPTGNNTATGSASIITDIMSLMLAGAKDFYERFIKRWQFGELWLKMEERERERANLKTLLKEKGFRFNGDPFE